MMLEHSALRPGGSAGTCAATPPSCSWPALRGRLVRATTRLPWLAAQFPAIARWPQYPCGNLATVAVTHPNKERSFSNHGHITRPTAGDVLDQFAAAGEGDNRCLCGTFLYQAVVRLSAAARHAPPARVYPLPPIPAGRPRAGATCCVREVDRWLATATGCCSTTLKLQQWPPAHSAEAAAAWRHGSAAAAAW